MNAEKMIDPNDLTIRGATRHDLDFVAWCNYTASSPAPGFCWWDPPIEGFGIETITFIRQAVALDVLAWCRIADFVIAENGSIPLAGAARFVMREDDYRPLNIRDNRAWLLYCKLRYAARKDSSTLRQSPSTSVE